MRKKALLLSGLLFFITKSASAFVIESGVLATLGLGLASALAPTVVPLGEKLVGKVFDEVKDGLKSEECPSRCINAPLKYCARLPVVHTDLRVSECKAKCQLIQHIGGYELRIRFGVKKDGAEWNILKCVRQAVESGYQTSGGKGRVKSIAVYSKEDLNDVLSLIALEMAAQQIIDTVPSEQKAFVPSVGKELTVKEGMTSAQLVEESKALVTHIQSAIERNTRVPENAPVGSRPKYGYQ